MKKLAILIAAFIVLVPTLGFSNAISFKVGYFIPQAKSDLWNIEFENMTFTKSNFQNSILSFGYERFLTKEISLVFSLETYSRQKLGSYKDYVGYEFDEGDFAFPAKDYEGDFAISHIFDVSIIPVQLSLKLTPLGRRGGLVPYVGGGAGVYIWNVRLRGDMVDFEDAWIYEDNGYEVDIYKINPTDARETTRFAIGYHAFGGVMFPIGNKLTLEAEFKYNFVKGGFRDAFEGFEKFDLSGSQVSIGINYWF